MQEGKYAHELSDSGTLLMTNIYRVQTNHTKNLSVWIDKQFSQKKTPIHDQWHFMSMDRENKIGASELK